MAMEPKVEVLTPEEVLEVSGATGEDLAASSGDGSIPASNATLGIRG